MSPQKTSTDELLVESISAGRLRLTLNWVGQQLEETAISWKDEKGQDTPIAELSPAALKLRDALERYVAGQRVTWPELPLAMKRCTPFTQEVLSILRTVPQGKTVTYGELAAMAGRPNAARGVGQIMHHNRWPLIVPCHRVIGSGGSMTGFSGSAGIPLKEYLLQLERNAR
ncbi:MGMT family protein [Desulfovibrio mangrovi]|uniref:methylated-DNA--[protein]-cysteine S-methyltransferase n=1 Tax=Desulfovibrio mangrovi TaxID=2976983 RepID=UPI00224860FC|nr:MGMT family protein [Desulfovibrio mangrovi]UZP69094.1 MGMT family protein [Desulfovibrio mangrovi]